MGEQGEKFDVASPSLSSESPAEMEKQEPKAEDLRREFERPVAGVGEKKCVQE